MQKKSTNHQRSHIYCLETNQSNAVFLVCLRIINLNLNYIHCKISLLFIFSCLSFFIFYLRFLFLQVLAADEEKKAKKLEEKKEVVIVESVSIEDPVKYNAEDSTSKKDTEPIAESRSGEPAKESRAVDSSKPAAESRVGKPDPDIRHNAEEIPDQLAVESQHARDYSTHVNPGFQIQAIPVPVPMKVIPGKLVIPAPPQGGKPHSSAPSYGGGRGGVGGHRKVSNAHPIQQQPPPPVFKQAHHAPPQNYGPAHSRSEPKYAPPPPPPPPGQNYAPPPSQNYAPPPPPAAFSSAPAQSYAPPPPAAFSSAPAQNYAPPPPPPPPASYSPPASNNFNLPPPPPPPPSYSPPAANTYKAPPPPAPVSTPGGNYGAPKPKDVYNPPAIVAPANNYIAPAAPPPPPPPAPKPVPVISAAPSLSNNYNAPPPAPVAKPVLAPVPVAKPSQLYDADVKPASLSIHDNTVSGSAIIQPNSVVPSDIWPNTDPDMPKISAIDVKCEKNLMKVKIEFDQPFYGIIFSKGHYSNVNCVHLPAALGRNSAAFDISINSCGTTGNTENGLYGYGSQSGSGTFFENTIVVQYDPQVQEVWDQARKLRCTWHDQYEKAVTFKPFPVDMLHVVPADFAGDNVGCWMQIQVGKGPWASEVSGLVKIGQAMTMVLAIKDDDNKFDMLVRNCMAHDGKRAPIQLVDQRGCVTRPKLMSPFLKIKNFGASASVLSYAYFKAFKFPDSMEVHFQCTIQICRYQCPEQCSSDTPSALPGTTYEASAISGKRTKRETDDGVENKESSKDIGVDRIIQVVSTRDLTFIPETEKQIKTEAFTAPVIEDQASLICMSTPGFAATLVVLLAILIVSCLLSAFLCLRFRGHGDTRSIISNYDNPVFMHKKGHF